MKKPPRWAAFVCLAVGTYAAHVTACSLAGATFCFSRRGSSCSTCRCEIRLCLRRHLLSNVSKGGVYHASSPEPWPRARNRMNDSGRHRGLGGLGQRHEHIRVPSAIEPKRFVLHEVTCSHVHARG